MTDAYSFGDEDPPIDEDDLPEIDPEEIDPEEIDPDEIDPDELDPDDVAAAAGIDPEAKPAPAFDLDDPMRPVKGPPSTVDPDAEVANPDTKIPARQDMMEALEKAFSAEEGIEEGLLERYADHAELVLEGNRTMNLTANLDPFDLAAKDYLDCWRATRLLPLMGRSVCDLGSGPGFPGIPIAMAEPHTRVMMVDSTRRRAEFLNEVIEKLKLKNCSAVWDRGEEHLARNKYDMVVMRGVSSVRENVRTLRKVRHSHKDLVMLKGPSWSRETRAGEREVERLGFRLDTVWEHMLPIDKGARAVLVFRAPGGMGE
ncbi:MAG: 16S rRNA (guanine527-N7)-methyltransferase [Planctomycetota bacterium]|jgi:16S rRNA (guanine527-N7)-methyltransferase